MQNNRVDPQALLRVYNQHSVTSIRHIDEFDKFLKNRSTNKVLYHFTYNGMKNDNLVFSSKILSESNTDKELFETFDKISKFLST